MTQVTKKEIEKIHKKNQPVENANQELYAIICRGLEDFYFNFLQELELLFLPEEQKKIEALYNDDVFYDMMIDNLNNPDATIYEDKKLLVILL